MKALRFNRFFAFIAFGWVSLVTSPATARIDIKDCDASAMEDVNWAVDYLSANLASILTRASYLPSKYTDRIRKDWGKTTIRCSGKKMCKESNQVMGFQSTGNEVKLCWDNLRQNQMTRCQLASAILHEKGHAANIPIEKKHNEWIYGYGYVPQIDLVYRLGEDTLAQCQEQVDGSGSKVDWAAGNFGLESSNTGKLAIGKFCSRDSQCLTNSCEKGTCACKSDSDCSGSLRCVNRLGKNFCVPPADTLGAYCKGNSDCGQGTCEQNACSCKTDGDCRPVAGSASRCAKPLFGKNFCQPTNTANGDFCQKDSDCRSKKCKSDVCVAK